MKIHPETGQIAYHSYLLMERGGLEYIQYDFDGTIEERYVVRRPLPYMHLSDTA